MIKKKLGGNTAILWVVALAFLPLAPNIGMAQEPDCQGCSRISPVQLRHVVSELRHARVLHAKIFYARLPDFPVELSPRAVEIGARCTLTDSGEIAKLVQTMSELRTAPSELYSIEPVAEIRFYRPDRPSERPVLEAFLDDATTGLDPKRGPITVVIINGQIAMVYARPVNKLLDFIRDKLTGRLAGKTCDDFKASGN